MTMLRKGFWFLVCFFAFFFSQLFFFFFLIFALYKIGLERLSHLYTVLFGTEEEIMKLDKSQGGLYDFTNTGTCYRKADERAKEFTATGNIEKQGIKKGRIYKIQF